MVDSERVGLCEYCGQHTDTFRTYWIIAKDQHGKAYVFSTNPKMLEKGALETFQCCDLSRYPMGDREGFNNEVELFTCYFCEQHRNYAHGILEVHGKRISE